jgi:hypothetical protein
MKENITCDSHKDYTGVEDKDVATGRVRQYRFIRGRGNASPGARWIILRPLRVPRDRRYCTLRPRVIRSGPGHSSSVMAVAKLT